VENAYKSWSFSNPGGDNTTLRFEVRPGDHWSSPAWTDPVTSERSEIAAATRYNLGTDIHVSYDFMVEPGAANHSQWLVIGQMHHTGSTWSPPLEIDLVGEKMAVKINEAGNSANSYSAYKTMWMDSQNIVRGQTYHIDLNVRFDANGNGHFDFSRDGVQLVNYNGTVGWTGMGSQTYWKEGIYRSASDTTIAADYSHLSITTGSTPTSSTSTTSSTTTSSAPTAATSSVPHVDDVTMSGGSKFTLTGGAAAGSTVKVYDGHSGALIGTAKADSTGDWSLSSSFSSGSHNLVEKVTDAAGHTTQSTGAAVFDGATGVSLWGGGGDDVLVGRPGDTLHGQGGHDTFVFNPGFGKETVADFDATADKVSFDHALFSSASSVLQHAHQVGSSVQITYDANDVVTLQNTSLSSLTQGNFVFV
jgi:hypothetical protein